jgi:hypothetical protein
MKTKLFIIYLLLTTNVFIGYTQYDINLVKNYYGVYYYKNYITDQDAKNIADLGFKYVILYTQDFSNLADANIIINTLKNNNLGVIVHIDTLKETKEYCQKLTLDNIIGWVVLDEVDTRNISIDKQNQIIDELKKYTPNKIVFGSANQGDFPINKLSDKYDYIFISNYVNDLYKPDGYILWDDLCEKPIANANLLIGGTFGFDKCIPAFESYRDNDKIYTYSTIDETMLNFIWTSRRNIFNKPGPFFIYRCHACNYSTIENNSVIKTTVENFVKNTDFSSHNNIFFNKAISTYYDPICKIQAYGNGDISHNGIVDNYLVGDWDGDGTDNIAVRRDNEIVMDTNFDGCSEIVFVCNMGNPDEYLVGDWDGDGRDNIAVRSGNLIKMDITFDGITDITFSYGYGNAEDEYLVGDWDGDGRDNIAVRRDNEIVMDTNFDGNSEIRLKYGNGNMLYNGIIDNYLVGNWDGKGGDNIAVRRGNKIYADTNFDKEVEIVYIVGNENDNFIVGDWDGDHKDDIGIRNGDLIYKMSDATIKWSSDSSVPTYGNWYTISDNVLRIDLGQNMQAATIMIKEYDAYVRYNCYNDRGEALALNVQPVIKDGINIFTYLDFNNLNSRFIYIYAVNNPNDLYKIKYLGYMSFTDKSLIYLNGTSISNLKSNSQTDEITNNLFTNNSCIKVYPNSIQSNVKIINPENKHCTITISNYVGRIINKIETYEESFIIDLRNYKNGLYIITVNNKQKFKVIKVI